MSNVIRPAFGARPQAIVPPAPIPIAEEFQLLRVYGIAAGHLVALLRDDDAPEGQVFKIVVGPEAGNELETVTVLPATTEGEAGADMAAMAVLRALAIVANRGGGAEA